MTDVPEPRQLNQVRSFSICEKNSRIQKRTSFVGHQSAGAPEPLSLKLSLVLGVALGGPVVGDDAVVVGVAAEEPGSRVADLKTRV